MICKAKRVLVTALLLVTMVSNFVAVSYANGPTYVFIDANGEKIHYYLDDEGYPYCIRNGEKVYLALPLSHLKITDQDIIDELNTAVEVVELKESESKSNTISQRSVPTNYYELRLKSNPLESSYAYSNYYSFDNYTTHNTPVFKMSTKHALIRFRSKDIEKPLFGSKKISFVFRYYHKTLDEWSRIIINDVDCTSTLGYDFEYLSETSYAQYILLIPDDVEAYTAVVWTTVE